MRQIVVAFERQSNCDRLREALESTGEFSCLTCRSLATVRFTAAQVKRTVAKLRLDLVVCGFKLTDESCETLYFDLPQRCAMLMVAPQAQLELCAAPGIFKLPAPVGRGSLLASVRMLGPAGSDQSGPRPAQPGGKGAGGAGQNIADGTGRHDGSGGPPVAPKAEHGPRRAAGGHRPAGAGEILTGQRRLTERDGAHWAAVPLTSYDPEKRLSL